MGRMDDLDGNTAALNLKERSEDRLDREQAMIEAAARPLFDLYMTQLDTDVIEQALDGLTRDELNSLIEDLGTGPMRDLAHAGSIVSDAVKRHVYAMAVKDVG